MTPSIQKALESFEKKLEQFFHYSITEFIEGEKDAEDEIIKIFKGHISIESALKISIKLNKELEESLKKLYPDGVDIVMEGQILEAITVISELEERVKKLEDKEKSYYERIVQV